MRSLIDDWKGELEQYSKSASVSAYSGSKWHEPCACGHILFSCEKGEYTIDWYLWKIIFCARSRTVLALQVAFAANTHFNLNMQHTTCKHKQKYWMEARQSLEHRYICKMCIYQFCFFFQAVTIPNLFQIMPLLVRTIYNLLDGSEPQTGLMMPIHTFHK